MLKEMFKTFLILGATVAFGLTAAIVAASFGVHVTPPYR